MSSELGCEDEMVESYLIESPPRLAPDSRCITKGID